MDAQPTPQPKSNTKAKVIAAGLIIAVIAVLYLLLNNPSADTASTASSDTATTTAPATTDSTASTTDSTSASTAEADATYADGSYSASASYRTPDGNEAIDVTLTLQDGTVTASSVSQDPQDPKAVRYQNAFKENYQDQVVGKKIDDINLSRISGSSLTSNGFNDALEDIKTQAASQV